MTRPTAKPGMKDRILHRFGLTTSSRLERESAARARWHGLVRDVFARYYLKFREPFYTCLPPLPHRYTTEWEGQMKSELQRFLEMDLQPVAELLEVCGFGKERWDRICERGFAPFDEFISALLSTEELPRIAGEGEQSEALVEAHGEIRKLRIAGRRALEKMRGYQARIAQMEQLEQPLAESGHRSDDGPRAPDGDPDFPARSEESDEDRLTALQQELAERDERIKALLQELEDAPTSTEDSLLVDDDLARQNAQLRGELRAKERTIEVLTQQAAELQDAMDSARGQLMDQVKKLGDLAAGEIELKPSEELESMNADELLDYAQEVASDLDVKKQVLNEGIEGIEEVRANYDESRSFYEAQQRKFQSQLEEMSAQVERYQLEQQNEDGTAENTDELIATQRHQLELLKSRITELSNTNKNLGLSNSKMYKDLEGAVQRLIPLRRQIAELENLRETLCRYIREKHERTFTIRKLK